MKLAGKVAVVTGASRGIGREIAIALAEEGADVPASIGGMGSPRVVAGAVVFLASTAGSCVCAMSSSSTAA